MAIVYRPQYPDAATKAAHYSNVAARLRTGRTALQGNITAAQRIRAGDYESTSLNGDYYDQYVGKKDDWITQFNQIAISFDQFTLQVDHCIQRADNLASTWNSRINIMEAYDDGR